MKKLILSLSTAFLSLTLLAAAPATDINAKVLAAFQTAFKGASDIQWLLQEEAYEVKFKYNDIRSRITYDADGNILQALRYYGEEQLPFMVRARLNEKYSDKKVHGVTELSNSNELSYYVILEDAKHWTTVKCDSYGNITQQKKMKKA